MENDLTIKQSAAKICILCASEINAFYALNGFDIPEQFQISQNPGLNNSEHFSVTNLMIYLPGKKTDSNHLLQCLFIPNHQQLFLKKFNNKTPVHFLP